MHHVVSLHNKIYSTLSLLTQGYKWVPVNCWVKLTERKLCDGLAYHPRGGGGGGGGGGVLMLTVALITVLAFETSPQNFQ